MSSYFFSADLIPSGFQYPKSYLEFFAQDPIPDLGPWWFLCEFKESADFWLGELRRQYPSRALIPFAKMADSDDVACFDAKGAAEDPVVHYVHAYASPGWEDRGHVSNFTEWLEAAEQEAAHEAARNE
jgi:hypothetical protein